MHLYPSLQKPPTPTEEKKSTVFTESEVNLHRPDRLPLSFSQESLWFIDKLEGSVQYHVPMVLRVKGAINNKALAGALHKIIERHEVLRTVFVEEDGQAYQFIKEASDWELLFVDGAVFTKNEGGLTEYIGSLINKAFDLSKDYMLRAHLIKLGEEDHVLAVTLHHIATDGWSMSIITSELGALYNAYQQGRQVELAPLKIQYADFAIWQRQYLQGNVFNGKVDYWKQQLEGVAPLELPTDHVRPAIQSSRGATTAFTIDKALSDELQALSLQQEATLFMTLLTAFKVLLYRYSGQEDICVGIPIAGRQHHEVEDLVGFFVNTLAVRSEVSGTAMFANLLQQVKATMLQAYEHQEVPFEKVVEVVATERDRSRNPLVQVLFVLQNTPDSPLLRLGETELQIEAFAQQVSKFDITLSIKQTTEGLKCEWEYCNDLYEQQTIIRLMQHYEQLLRSVVKNPQQQIGKIPMLTSAEENQLLVEFNDTEVVYPKDKTMVDLFEEQVELTPENIAVVFEEQQLTYKELNKRANQLAHYLASKGVKEDTLVPICIERSLDMIVGIMGILKAGGAYVPIDPEYPLERIGYILSDTGAKVIVCNKSSKSRFQHVAETVERIIIDEEWSMISKWPAANLPLYLAPSHLAYIIYTSGSTGTPKGVMVEHKNVVRLFKTASPLYDFNEKDVWTMFHSFCFDFSVWELYGALFYGGRLIIVPRHVTKDVTLFAKLLISEKVTILNQTPSAFYILQDSLVNKVTDMFIRYVIFGGEALDPSRLQPWKECFNECRLINMYGITETTVHVTYKEIEWKHIEASNSIIGKPIPTLNAYILDNNQYLVPIGVIGQIYISGDGLARGYLNRPALTAEKFVENPFKQGDRLYKTGDLGRWLPDGNIEYFGRLDEQVKIRGYRIELGEIESVLMQSGLVSQCVVLAKQDKQGNKRLIGYIIPNGDIFNREAILAHLKERLPEYMVPAIWIKLDRLPLTVNGKVDKKSLPDDLNNHLSNQYVAPETELQVTLANIWQQLLGVHKIGIRDNFFQVGGHSLMATRIVSAIRKQLQTELSIKDLFLYPTVAELATALTEKEQQQKQELLPAITKAKRTANIPLSYSQERLWFIDKLEGSVQYHVPMVLRVKGAINNKALTLALHKIIERHEVLRTVFVEEEGQAYQFIKEASDWELFFVDGAVFTKNEGGLTEYIGSLINKAFDLCKDYMLRAHLIKLGEEDHVLAVTIHHIATDGWSMSIITSELGALYNAYQQGRHDQLAPLKIQYADFAIWQRNNLTGEVIDKKIQYWLNKLEDVTPIELPLDYIRPAILSGKGKSNTFRIERDITEKLRQLSRENDVTLFMTMLTAFNVLLHRYTGQHDISVGTPVANRTHYELENMIGFFVNMLVIRSAPDPNLSFLQLLQQIKNTTLEAYENGEVPFEKIVERIAKQRNLNRGQLFQVAFTLQNADETKNLQLGDIVTTLENIPQTEAKFEVMFNLTETYNGIDGVVEYSTDLYKEETIKRMMANFTELLSAICINTSTSISLLPVICKLEKKEIIDFNKPINTINDGNSVARLFVQQAAKTPLKKAVVLNDQQLTYQQLDEQSNQLANYLSANGIKAGDAVGLLTARSIEMIVGIFGIIKSGASYVPLNTEFPNERLKFILENSNSKLVVYSNAGLLNSCGLASENSIDISAAANYSTTFDPFGVDATAPLYIMYTSGTTGRPKGIAVSNQNVINLVNQSNEITVTSTDRMLQWSNYGFDGSVYEIFSALLKGATLCLLHDGWSADVFALEKVIKEQQVTIGFMTTAIFNSMVDANPMILAGMRKILVGGEAVSAFHIHKAIKAIGPDKIINGYGPTETTVFAVVGGLSSLNENEFIPIGRPLDNVKCIVLDAHKNIVPIGVMGELYVGGAGISLGYVNNENLTSEKFVTLFAENKAERFYKTGDLVRWNSDGQIEFIGRRDDQVKIRGYRIEPAEIENTILQSGLVHQAVVLVNQDGNKEKRLVAYMVANSGFNKKKLLDYLTKNLPAYMVPRSWVELKEIPLNANGKIDKKSLSALEVVEMVTSEYVAPQTDIEIKLANIWKELLVVNKVGVNDNFFELGGHSLLAIRLVNAINKKMNADISVSDIFIYSTIVGLERLINQSSEAEENISKYKYLVPIKYGSDKKAALYIVCGGGGTSKLFMEFAKMLDDEQTVYALQPPIGGKYLKEFPTTVELIAEKFIKEILLINPNGPYALTGHCAGGIIAFEMAKQLQAMGKKIHLLAMFDTVLNKNQQKHSEISRSLLRFPKFIKTFVSQVFLKIHFESFLLRRHTKQAVHYKVNSFKKFIDITRDSKNKIENDGLEYAGLEIFNESSDIYVNACNNYQLTPYDNDIALFYAKDHYYFLDKDKKIAFKKFVIDDETKNRWKLYSDEVRLYDVDGEHSSMFESAHGAHFAKILQKELNKNATI